MFSFIVEYVSFMDLRRSSYVYIYILICWELLRRLMLLRLRDDGELARHRIWRRFLGELVRPGCGQ